MFENASREYSGRTRTWSFVPKFRVATKLTSLGVLCAAHKKIHCSVAVICVHVSGLHSFCNFTANPFSSMQNCLLKNNGESDTFATKYKHFKFKSFESRARPRETIQTSGVHISRLPHLALRAESGFRRCWRSRDEWPAG